MARSPTPTSGRTVLLQPQASPVDAYVAPGPNRLEELGRSLAPIDKPLQEFFNKRAQEHQEKQLAQADADFALDPEKAEAQLEGIRRGMIAPQYSPAYLRRTKELVGDRLGASLSAEWLREYETWEGRNSDDDAALDGKFGAFLRSRVEAYEDSPEILAAALPHIQALSKDAVEAHVRYRSGQVREEALRANLASVNMAVDDAEYGGLKDGKAADYSKGGDAVDQLRGRFIAQGGAPDEWDKGTMALMARQAIELRNPRLLDFFKRKVPGKDYTYGDTPEGGAIVMQATDKLETIARQAIVDEGQEAERQRKAQLAAAELGAVTAMRSGGQIPEEVLAAGEKADPLFRTKMGDLRQNLAQGERDPALVKEITQEILSGAGTKAVLRASKRIRSPEDLDELLNRGAKFEATRQSYDDILSSGAAKAMMDAMASRTKAAGSFFDPVTGLTNEGMEAQFDFRRRIDDWLSDNMDASSSERDEAVNKIGRTILDRFKAGPDGVSAYDRDPALGGQFDNPHTGAVGPQANAMPAAGSGSLPASMSGAAEDPKTPAVDYGEAGKIMGSMVPPEGITTREQFAVWSRLSTDEKASLQAGAAAKKQTIGASLDHLTGQGWKPKGNAASAPDGTPVDPIAYRPTSEPQRPADLQFLASRATGGATRPDSFTKMRPEFASGVEAMIRGAPPEIASGLQVMSGYRSPERQAELWKDALRKYGSAAEARKWVAPPGRSGHNHGHAADLAFNGVRLDKAPPKVRKWVHENAEKFGLAFPLSNEAWHVELSGARNGGGGAGRRTFTQADAESFLTAALSLDALDAPGESREDDGAFVAGDVAGGRLLDLIGQNESGGNYNAVFGNARSDIDLSTFSLNEILRQQQASKRTKYSTAIGKYQFLQDTLSGLKEELGLTGAEKFTPDLQDRLAVALLERRGYSAFKAGKISKRQFALRLSQEWASVENPGTGRSYYAGDGFHGKAHTKTQQVYAALGLPAFDL